MQLTTILEKETVSTKTRRVWQVFLERSARSQTEEEVYPDRDIDWPFLTQPKKNIFLLDRSSKSSMQSILTSLPKHGKSTTSLGEEEGTNERLPRRQPPSSTSPISLQLTHTRESIADSRPRLAAQRRGRRTHQLRLTSPELCALT